VVEVGGFGSVFAVATVGIIIAFSLGAFAKLTISYMTLTTSMPPVPSRPQVESGYMQDPETCFVNITMGGSKGLPVSKLGLVEVFVAYRSGGSLLSTRLERDSGWSAVRVFVGSGAGELVNPVDLAKGTGIWDPGETLELKLQLPLPSDGGEWYFLMVLPDGGECSWTFS
jgi:hypothetical protein